MKSQLIIFASIVLFGIVSCKKVPGCTDSSADNFNYAAEVEDGSCEYSGQVVFWINSVHNYIDVTLVGSTKTISVYYPANGVDCSSSGCAIFTLSPGTYTYSALEQGTSTPLVGGVTIVAGSCTTILLL